jgi:hypothetical protein
MPSYNTPAIVEWQGISQMPDDSARWPVVDDEHAARGNNAPAKATSDLSFI